MGFVGYNSGSRHARRSIMGSKDADDRVVFKKSLSQINFLSQINDSLDWRLRPGKVGKNLKNMPSL